MYIYPNKQWRSIQKQMTLESTQTRMTLESTKTRMTPESTPTKMTLESMCFWMYNVCTYILISSFFFNTISFSLRPVQKTQSHVKMNRVIQILPYFGLIFMPKALG